jgi:hypothetical protein
MLRLALWLAALTAPGHFSADHLAGLDSPSYRAREQATRELRSRLTWPAALHLALHPPASPEARARVRRLVEEYFSLPLPDWRCAPFIDSLTCPRCDGTRGWWSRWVRQAKAALAGYEGPWVNFPEYRLATILFFQDLQRWRLPPSLMRAALALMEARQRSYDASHGGPR